jgi:hypothetical protein
MWTSGISWTRSDGWVEGARRGDSSGDAALVLYFAAPEALDVVSPFEELSRRHPSALVVGCTTGGEILGGDVRDGSVVAAALGFESASVRAAIRDASGRADSESIGRSLGEELSSFGGLRALFVLSDGMGIDGDALVSGCVASVGSGVSVTGGLAGDGARFERTLVGCGGPPIAGRVVAIGFFGQSVLVGSGCVGGWTPFGPSRTITRSRGNVLLELDGEPALDLYSRYLGDDAAGLPGSALLFPLSVSRVGVVDSGSDVVRTIVGIDESERSLVFAGGMPEGSSARLMRGRFEALIDGAAGAAGAAFSASGFGGGDGGSASLALLVSCIGRKLLMGQRVGEEAEVVASVMGADCECLGFYSYGELAPPGLGDSCRLHNQTMTVTFLSEA